MGLTCGPPEKRAVGVSVEKGISERKLLETDREEGTREDEG